MDINKYFTNKISVALLSILCCLLWGSAFPSIKSGFLLLNIADNALWLKLLFAGYRFFLAGLLILLFSIFSGLQLKLDRALIKPLVIMALFSSTLQYLFFYIGLSHTSGINASILNSVLTFFSIILAHFFLANDKLNTKKAIGIILGFSGIILMNFSPALLKLRFSLFGDGFVILSQLSGAIAFIYLKKISGKVAIVPFTAYQMLLGSTLLILPPALKVGLMPFKFSLTSALLLVYLAVLSAVAFSLWNTLIKYNAVGEISLFLFLIPVFGVFLSAVFLQGEKITLLTVLALILVSLGLTIVNGGQRFEKLIKNNFISL